LPGEFGLERLVLLNPPSPGAGFLTAHLDEVLEQTKVSLGPAALDPQGVPGPFHEPGGLVLHLEKDPG